MMDWSPLTALNAKAIRYVLLIKVVALEMMDGYTKLNLIHVKIWDLAFLESFSSIVDQITLATKAA